MTDIEQIAGYQHQVVQALQREVQGLHCAGSSSSQDRVSIGVHEQDERFISSGCESLDQLLPSKGFRRGSLTEWLSDQPGSGAETLSLIVARQAMQRGGALVVLDRAGLFYPPAAASWGIDLERLVLIRPQHQRDERWAVDQALRCGGVAAVWAVMGHLDGRWFRRFQLAAESSGCLGLLLRSAKVRGMPSWSEIQLQVHPRPSASARRIGIELVRCRGQGSPGVVELELDELTGELRGSKSRNHEKSSLHLATQLANPTSRRRSTRA